MLDPNSQTIISCNSILKWIRGYADTGAHTHTLAEWQLECLFGVVLVVVVMKSRNEITIYYCVFACISHLVEPPLLVSELKLNVTPVAIGVCVRDASECGSLKQQR